METTYAKIFVLIALLVGEALSIYAEMLGARNSQVASQPFMQVFLKMFLLITLAGGFLIAGYMLGFMAFKNIWIVSVASITAILIVEPLLAWTVFQQVPTIGAIIGFILGGIGLFLSIFF